MKYHGNQLCREEQTNKQMNAADGQPKNITPSPILSDDSSFCFLLCGEMLPSALRPVVGPMRNHTSSNGLELLRGFCKPQKNTPMHLAYFLITEVWETYYINAFSR